MQTRRGRTRVAIAGVLLASACLLAGCSSQIADMPSLESSEVTPPAPKEPAGYLPVNDLPRAREEAMMSPEERARIEKELTAARDRQAQASIAAAKEAAKEAAREAAREAGR